MQGLMMDYPLTLTQFFERSRRLFAQKTLATRVSGRPLFRYTYADFAERVARLAGGLTALGVRPGDRVGTFAWNTHHALSHALTPRQPRTARSTAVQANSSAVRAICV
jgi:acyl-CoA synthetase (AMP-forming)/AMP-acid ligase II